MLLQFVLTSLLVNVLYALSEGSNDVNQTKEFNLIKSDLVELKSVQTLIKTDQRQMTKDIGVIKSDQYQIKSDEELIKDELILNNAGQENIVSILREIIADKQVVEEELTLLNTGQTRLENTFNVLLEKLEPIQPPKVSTPRNCAEAMSISKQGGIYEIRIPSLLDQTFNVTCSAETRGGNWTIILRRMDGSVDFYRKWADYKAGFGNLAGEFFLGLDKIYALTNDQPQELLVLLEDNEGEVRYEAYDAFAIGDELDRYRLHTLGAATGTAGDSLSYQHEMNFSSQDRDNDLYEGNCAEEYNGGWWYNSCHHSNLMGRYGESTFAKGVNWFGWHGHAYSLKGAIMMIRPKVN